MLNAFPSDEGFKHAVFPGSSCQIGQRRTLRENRPPGSCCHSAEMLLNVCFIPAPKLQKEHSRLQALKLTHTSPA